MDHLPNEVIINIFQCLPQRYISVLSTVCKKWQSILLQPLFFNSLDIYSIHHLNKYIEMGKIKTINNSNIPLGYSVKHIYFYTHYPIYTKVLLSMIETFPNLHSIQGSFTLANNNSPFFIYKLHQLEHIPYWYQNYDPDWMDIVSNYPHKIKSLEFTLIPKFLASNIIQQKLQQTSAPSSSLSSSLILPIINFLSIAPFKTRPSDFNFFDLINYKIHTINLPILPSLTYLSIDCLDIDGDERVFESIHQSCLHLISLTLKSFKLHISDDYDNKITNQLIEPNISLKELSIGNNIYDSKCYDYLSIKYPHLESFTLTLNSRTYPQSSFTSFRLAIFNMITHYKYLKKLITKLECKHFQAKVWPHAELMHWLQKNPTQLSHMDYSYVFINDILTTNNLNNHQDQHQIHSGRILSQPSHRSSFTFNNDNIFIQPHHYLNHLSSLSLGREPFNAIYILYYFYLCNKVSNFLSNSIEELKIDTFVFGSIYYWLNAFPNLKSLSVTGNTVLSNINNEHDEDDDYDVDYYYDNDGHDIDFKEIYKFFKKKTNRKKQNNSDSTVITNHHHHHHHHYHYKLKKIEIKSCNVGFKKYGWNGFFKNFSDLKTIILFNINPIHIAYSNQLIKEPAQQATLDLSHLSLDMINIKKFNYDQYLLETPRNHYVKELMIKETSSNKSYYVGYGNEHKNNAFNYPNSTTLNIICKSVNNLVFDQIPTLA